MPPLPSDPLACEIAPPDRRVTPGQLTALMAQACPAEPLRGRRILLIIPDHTRTAPIGAMFKALFAQLGGVAKKIDVMIALGTHPAMTDAEINARVEITAEERTTTYRAVEFINHEWNRHEALQHLGYISANEISSLSGGLFAIDVPVHINRRVFDYDQLIIIGPVFPHEVVGFSGGNKYLFPGIGGPEVLHFFHWLGAVVTNPMIIGNKWTPVRRVVDRAAAMVLVPKICFCMVVTGQGELAGLFAGTPESAWDRASELSKEIHITYKERPFRAVLSCAPEMYDELWVGGKAMYKLEPVVADGGEIILYAPHIRELSAAHGAVIERVGYHCRDYFLKQWDRFSHEPWGVLAHLTHLYGVGTYDDETGLESPRIRVTLATGLSESTCRKINLGYRDWRTINPADFADCEDEGVLLVPKAGERLYHLRDRPAWAGGR
ncbi:MAG TPA: lactate racemase domain-containing protein [Opitutaceae bacterium]|nr:lactate racemase domain-containing protein [Opitutaceae bacterium]